jgi:hypothetical protein
LAEAVLVVAEAFTAAALAEEVSVEAVFVGAAEVLAEAVPMAAKEVPVEEDSEEAVLTA